MSRNVGPSDRREPVDSEHGLDALRPGLTFLDPVEPSPNHDHANALDAFVSETRVELFAADVPFVRRGPEGGEQCISVTKERSEQDAIVENHEGAIRVESDPGNGSTFQFTLSK